MAYVILNVLLTILACIVSHRIGVLDERKRQNRDMREACEEMQRSLRELYK
jgi:hypothetical protein